MIATSRQSNYNCAKVHKISRIIAPCLGDEIQELENPCKRKSWLFATMKFKSYTYNSFQS